MCKVNVLLSEFMLLVMLFLQKGGLFNSVRLSSPDALESRGRSTRFTKIYHLKFIEIMSD